MAVVTDTVELTEDWQRISDEQNIYISLKDGFSYEIIFTDDTTAPDDTDVGHIISRQDLNFYNGQVETTAYYVWVRKVTEPATLAVTLF